MIGSQYLMFCNYFRKFREPPLKGILLKNSKNGEGANGSLPFFVGWNSYVQEMNQWKRVNEILGMLEAFEIVKKYYNERLFSV